MQFKRLLIIILVFFTGLFALRGPIQNIEVNLAVLKEQYFDTAVNYVKNLGKDNDSSAIGLSEDGNSASGDGQTLGDADTISNENTATNTNAVKKPVATTEVRAGTKPVLFSKNNSLTADSSRLTNSGILLQTNKERVSRNLGALKFNSNLNSAAQMKLEDMFKNQYFEHVSPAGADVTDLVRRANYEYIVVGENLALGNFGGDIQVVTAWMNSPGHRANILDGRFQEIGLAVGTGLYNGKEQWIAVQHFAKPLSSCESTSSELKTRIDLHTTQLAALESELAAQKTQIDSSNSQTEGYSQLVEKYNYNVATYNNQLAGLKDEISTYNEQVRAFNSCAGLNKP